MSRKWNLLSIVLCLTMVIFLCACQTQNADSDIMEDPMEITFSFWEPGSYLNMENVLRKIADDYEKEHTNVHIELISKPVSEYNDWIKTRIIADDMPDIESSHSGYLASQYDAGLIVDISDKLDLESPYTPGCKWKDTFIEKRMMQANSIYQNHRINIPFFGTELAIFYNKTIYKNLGLSEPKTWREFMDNCEIIKESKMNPIVLMGQKSDTYVWLMWEIGQGLYNKKFLADKNININGDLKISEYEKARAILLGYWDISKDEKLQYEYRNYIDHLKQYLSYCCGSLEMEESIAKTMFLNGEAAHINSGEWDAKNFLQNPDLSFEVGVFKFPEFTIEDTEYPGGRISTDSAQCLAVTKSVYKEPGKLEATIDFLQYLTSQEVYQEFINETMELPAVKNIEYDDIMEGFINDGLPVCSSFYKESDAVRRGIMQGNIPEFNQEYFDKIQTEYLQEAMDVMKIYKLSADDGYYYDEEQYGGVYNESK